MICPIPKLILYLTIALIYTNLSAQDLVVLPADTIIVKGSSTKEMLIAEGKLKNISSIKQTYYWERIKIEIPSIWKVSTCVPGNCYSADKDSGYFTLPAQAEGILDQNFFSKGTSGNCLIEIRIYKNSKSSKLEKLVIFKAEIY